MTITPRFARAKWVPWSITAAALTFALLASWTLRGTSVSAVPMRFSANVGANVSLVAETGSAGGAAAVLSPDGTLAFVGQKSDGTSQLFVRPLSQLAATALAGTDLARYPFFSPDGSWIGFFANGKLKKIAVAGGPAFPLADALDARGGTWAEDGTIAFMPGGKTGSNLVRVPASGGGKPTTLTALADGEITQRWPQFLNGGKAILFTSHTRIGDYADASLVVQSLTDGRRRVVASRAFYGRYVPSGHLLFVRDGALFAMPFDLRRLESIGDPVPVVTDLVTRSQTGSAQFDVSGAGTLTYLARTQDSTPLQLMDRNGATTSLPDAPLNWRHPRFSPDGRRIAMEIVNGDESDVWVYDLTTGAKTRLTVDRTASSPVWTPDGRRIVFASRRGGSSANLFWQRSDGSGDVQRLTDSANNQVPESWHPDGRSLVFGENRQSTDVMILPLTGDDASGWKPGTPVPFATSPAHELNPRVSPDGRWIAYAYNEAARFVVHVRPVAGPGGPWVVSSGVGLNPTWSRARHELFYTTPDEQLMVVRFTVSADSFRAEPAKRVSDVRIARGDNQGFDVHPDGERFVLSRRAQPNGPAQNKLVFVFNFFDELQRVAPSR